MAQLLRRLVELLRHLFSRPEQRDTIPVFVDLSRRRRINTPPPDARLFRASGNMRLSNGPPPSNQGYRGIAVDQWREPTLPEWTRPTNTIPDMPWDLDGEAE